MIVVIDIFKYILKCYIIHCMLSSHNLVYDWTIIFHSIDHAIPLQTVLHVSFTYGCLWEQYF